MRAPAFRTLFTLGLLLGAPSLAHAQPAPVQPLSPIDRDLLMAGFANNHPDLFHRRNAQNDFSDGDHARGMRRLRLAAYYADKPAQALMAEILWKGLYDQPVDRPAAYAWMDLAAERGYPELLRLRETYWHALTPDEQQQALSVGQEIYARYGDDQAQPRLARKLRKELRNVTGSRTGFAANTVIHGPVPNSTPFAPPTEDVISPMTTIQGSQYYALKHWQPNLYAKQQDLRWKQGVTEQRSPMTNVGDLAPVKE